MVLRQVRRIAYTLLRLFILEYSPNPEERGFLQRAQTRSEGGVQTVAAVPSDEESEHIFGVRLSHRGLQVIWLDIANGTDESLWLDRVHLDPDYFTPLEAAHLARFAVAKRLVAFGLLGWLFIPLLPLLPLKVLSARAANQRVAELFRSLSFPGGVIAPGRRVSGFLFTPLDEAIKRVNVRLLDRSHAIEFQFTIEVPGLKLPRQQDDAEAVGETEDLDEPALRAWLERQTQCTSNARGTVEGDPLNLVIVADRACLEECFSTWDATETLTVSTAWKTAKAFLFESRYRYSPVSPLYLARRHQDLALQRARLSLNQRLHLRLWATGVRYGGQPVWIGQVSRDIGVRFTLKAWNLTTHLIDPDVDEARDYVLNGLLITQHVARLGLVAGVGAAPRETPRRNLTGDPYFTDGLRGVAILSRRPAAPVLLGWSAVSPSEISAVVDEPRPTASALGGLTG